MIILRKWFNVKPTLTWKSNTLPPIMGSPVSIWMRPWVHQHCAQPQGKMPTKHDCWIKQKMVRTNKNTWNPDRKTSLLLDKYQAGSDPAHPVEPILRLAVWHTERWESIMAKQVFLPFTQQKAFPGALANCAQARTSVLPNLQAWTWSVVKLTEGFHKLLSLDEV